MKRLEQVFQAKSGWYREAKLSPLSRVGAFFMPTGGRKGVIGMESDLDDLAHLLENSTVKHLIQAVTATAGAGPQL